MGVFIDDAVDGGVEIVALVPGGPAQSSGLERGDVLVRVGEVAVADLSDLEQVLRARNPGDEVEVRVLRAGSPLVRRLALGVRPARAWSVAPVPPAPPPAPAPPLAGLDVVEMTPELRRHFGAPPDTGVLVARVGTGTRAARSGLAAGDVLVRIDDRRAVDVAFVRSALSGPDARVVHVVRDRKPVTVDFVEAAGGSAGAEDRTARIEREIEVLERRIEELRRELDRHRDGGSEP
jgi:serine protease DegQ